ncbi:MAG: hypothetical protein AAFV95_10800 [Bacteroidota bacterium]
MCTVQKTKLPVHYTDPDQRTYDLLLQGHYSYNLDQHDQKIYGWTASQESPSLKGVINLYGFSVGTPSKNSQKKEKKDKDGNVVKRWTEYSYSATATGKGSLYIYGHSNPFQYNKKKKPSKSEEAKKAKAEAAKKDLEDNPFLSSEDIATAEESDIQEDKGLDNEELELVRRVSVDQSKTLKTSRTHKSARSAYDEFTSVQRPQLYNFKDAYQTAAYKSALNVLNNLYGFTPVNSRFYLKRMKTEKHGDYKMWNDACQATMTLFKGVRYNKPIDELQSKFDPIIAYFGKHVSRIPDSDKKARNMKKAAFHNLIYILYNLDRYDELTSWCEKAIGSKVTGRYGRKMLERAKKQEAHLAFHKMTTRHIDTNEEVEMDDIATEEVAVEGDANK